MVILSGNLAGSYVVGLEFQLSTVEEDSRAEVVENAESTGGGLEGLDLAVKSFAHRSGDAAAEVGQEVEQVAFERLGDFHHQRQSAASRPDVPAREELLGFTRIAIFSGPTKLFIERPRPRGVPLLVHERLELEPLGVLEFFGIEQPSLLAAGQALVALLLEGGVLPSAHLIHGSVEMLTDVKPVMNKLGLRSMRRHGSRIGRPSVDDRRLDLRRLLFRQGLPPVVGALLVPFLAHLQHPGPRQVGEHRDVVVPAAKALFIHADVPHVLQRTPRQAPLDRSFHDPMDAVPIEPQQRGRALHIVGRLEHAHGERPEQHREPRMFARPRNGDCLDRAVRTVRPRGRRAEHRLELLRIQAKSGSLRSVVGDRARPLAHRSVHRASAMLQPNLQR